MVPSQSRHISQICGCLRPLSHGFQPCQLPHRGSQGAGAARPISTTTHRQTRSIQYNNIVGAMSAQCADVVFPIGKTTGRLRHPPLVTTNVNNHSLPCITCINIPSHPQFSTPHPPANHPCRPRHPRSLPQATPPDPRKPRFLFALFCPGIAVSCHKAPHFSKKMVHNKK